MTPVLATQMLNELQWESLESRRDQSRLIMLYNILKQNIYLPSEYFPKFHSHSYITISLQTRSCHILRLAEIFCNTIDSIESYPGLETSISMYRIAGIVRA